MASFRYLPARVYYEREAAAFPAARRALDRLAGRPLIAVESKADIPAEHQRGDSLFIACRRGRPLARCPGSRGHLCCNYLTIDLYMGCPLGCSYCAMRSYLNFDPITVFVDSAPAVQAVRAAASARPDRPLRVGTGEVGDSLLLDPLFELTREFIEGLADLPNVSFEAKTKTDSVDQLLGIEPKGGAVIGFSLNAEPVAAAEDGLSSSVEERLAAAGRAVAAGYRLAFHFDPIIRSPGWELEYGRVLDRLAAFPAGRIAWISLGTFRYAPALKDKMEERPFLFDEYVRCRDGKYRYPQRSRSSMYRFFLERLQALGIVEVYLCMESRAVWSKVFGRPPMQLPALRDIFISASGLRQYRGNRT